MFTLSWKMRLQWTRDDKLHYPQSLCTVKQASIHGFSQPMPAPRSQDPHGNGVQENNVIPLRQVLTIIIIWVFFFQCLNSLYRNYSCDFWFFFCSPQQRPGSVITTLTPLLSCSSKHSEYIWQCLGSCGDIKLKPLSVSILIHLHQYSDRLVEVD